MRTITFASQKGGTGKSTLAIGLAVAAIADGEHVFVLETDLQGTISKWSTRRSNPEPVVERIANRFQLERELRNLERRGGTLAIIDTPGNDSEIAAEAIRLGDLCLIPARPSQADIEAAHPTLKAISRFDRGFAFVLNQAPVRGQRPTRAATALNEVGILALHTSCYATTIWIRSQPVSASRNSRLRELPLLKSALFGPGRNKY